LITNEKFLEFAKKILFVTDAVPEEECRSAISRAYYSLFHEARDTLRRRYSLSLIQQFFRQKRRQPIDRRRLNQLDKAYIRQMGFNEHKAYRDTLIDIGRAKEAQLFQNFRIKRNQADYELDLNFTKDDSKAIVEAIEKLMNQIKSL